ncbi:MAG: hypothetical protein HY863_18500 [Chloroflexi bacterium]|nr:hypothetical protein [Chloroflexota bacterium]
MLKQKVKAQKEVLGANLEAHLLEMVLSQITAGGAISTAEAVENLGQCVMVARMGEASHH